MDTKHHVVERSKGRCRPPTRQFSITFTSMFVFLLVALTGGQVGFYVGYHVGVKLSCPCPDIVSPVEPQTPECPSCDNSIDSKSRHIDASFGSLFPPSIEKIAVGIHFVPRDQFATTFDMGIPLEETKPGNEHVLIIYNHRDDAHPTTLRSTDHSKSNSSSTPPSTTSVQAATANCDYLNVVLTNVQPKRKQCVAVMGQHEAFHVQRWMRLPPKNGTLDSAVPLRFVGRFMDGSGANLGYTPPSIRTRRHWRFLQTYFDSIDSVLRELRPLAQKASRNNTLVVMFSNFGQSELIINFRCSARARNLDLSTVLVFATDLETKELVERLGMTVFYHNTIFQHLPSDASETFGDQTFSDMMKAKVMCLQMASLLGYDLLFQDADVVWFKEPLPYFHNASLPYFDILLADDGNENSQYLPYMGNGGFFYVRNNRNTKYLFNSLLLLSDSNAGDEQYHLNQLLAEHASMYGLKVKVLNRKEFPTGAVYHGHMDTMKAIFAGRIHPFMFHMSWTRSKTDKLLYFKQMGEWYVEERCIGTKNTTLTLDSSQVSLVERCCAANPLISCHYRDKPNLIACNETTYSSNAGLRGVSFW